MSKTLKFTLSAPSLTQPLSVSYRATKITVDINEYPTPPIDISKLPISLEIGGNITVERVFPQNSTFTSISYDGSPLILYDEKNNILTNDPKNYKLVKKIEAGIEYVDPNSNQQPPYANIFLLICCILMIIGGIYYYFFYTPIPENSKGGLFKIGE